MGEPTILLSISEMIGLSIGTPEVGVVDFNMLQNVLYCLAQQLRVLDKNVELRGPIAHLPQGRNTPQTINVNEFRIDPDATEDKRIADETQPITTATPDMETMLVVERKRNDNFDVERDDFGPLTPGSAATGGRAPEGAKTGEFGTRSGHGGGGGGGGGRASKAHGGAGARATSSQGSLERLSLVTMSKFNVLEVVVEDLKDRVYGSMPKNEDILEEVRSQGNIRAITDMWTSLNVSSRLEAAETGVSKLSSLIQDLVGELAKTGAVGKAFKKAIEAAARQEEGGEDREGTDAGASDEQDEDTTCPIAKDDITRMKAELKKLRKELDGLTNVFYSTIQEVQSGMDVLQGGLAAGGGGGGGGGVDAASGMDLPVGGEDAGAEGGWEEATEGSGARGHARGRGGTASVGPLMERLQALEKRMDLCCAGVEADEPPVHDQLANFQDQISALTKDLTELSAEVTAGKISPDLVGELRGLMDLFHTVQEMQEQLKQVHETALLLVAEKEDRQHHLNVLLEQIEFLKTAKMDREDMVEAMAEKADTRLLARKVSHDQFELACDDISRKLEHAVGKLNFQESLWQQALDDIQREIESKLDKLELSPVKDFFNSKLRQLQENLKQLASLRKEVEAAGTRKRLLRDVNCISCDANAVMPMEAPTGGATSKAMPANLSMKPYLSYELDTIRKQQACNVPQRNMHDWEAIDKQMQKPQTKVRSEVDKHLCNRYCGGSHTTTTAAQRVARVGHFVKQWGPDVVPLSSGFAAGEDGRLYKVSDGPNANAGPGGAEPVCTPKAPAAPRKSDTPRPSSRQQIFFKTPECRCVEGGRTTKG